MSNKTLKQLLNPHFQKYDMDQSEKMQQDLQKKGINFSSSINELKTDIDKYITQPLLSNIVYINKLMQKSTISTKSYKSSYNQTSTTNLGENQISKYINLNEQQSQQNTSNSKILPPKKHKKEKTFSLEISNTINNSSSVQHKQTVKQENQTKKTKHLKSSSIQVLTNRFIDTYKKNSQEQLGDNQTDKKHSKNPSLLAQNKYNIQSQNLTSVLSTFRTAYQDKNFRPKSKNLKQSSISQNFIPKSLQSPSRQSKIQQNQQNIVKFYTETTISHDYQIKQNELISTYQCRDYKNTLTIEILNENQKILQLIKQDINNFTSLDISDHDSESLNENQFTEALVKTNFIKKLFRTKTQSIILQKLHFKDFQKEIFINIHMNHILNQINSPQTSNLQQQQLISTEKNIIYQTSSNNRFTFLSIGDQFLTLEEIVQYRLSQGQNYFDFQILIIFEQILENLIQIEKLDLIHCELNLDSIIFQKEKYIITNFSKCYDISNNNKQQSAQTQFLKQINSNKSIFIPQQFKTSNIEQLQQQQQILTNQDYKFAENYALAVLFLCIQNLYASEIQNQFLIQQKIQSLKNQIEKQQENYNSQPSTAHSHNVQNSTQNLINRIIYNLLCTHNQCENEKQFEKYTYQQILQELQFEKRKILINDVHNLARALQDESVIALIQQAKTENYKKSYKIQYEIAQFWNSLDHYQFSQKYFVESLATINEILIKKCSILIVMHSLEVKQQLSNCCKKLNQLQESQKYILSFQSQCKQLQITNILQNKFKLDILQKKHLQQTQDQNLIKVRNELVKAISNREQNNKNEDLQAAFIYKNLGEIYQKLKAYSKMELNYQKAVQIFQKLNKNSEYVKLNQILNEYLKVQQESAKHLKSLEQEFSYNLKHEEESTQAIVQQAEQIGDAYFQINNDQKCEQFYTLAVQISSSVFENTDPYYLNLILKLAKIISHSKANEAGKLLEQNLNNLLQANRFKINKQIQFLQEYQSYFEELGFESTSEMLQQQINELSQSIKKINV